MRSLIVAAALTFLSCTQIQKPVTEPFFAATAPPEVQEFRWSNGKSPKSFDPARASAAPETDIVRAIYEGLTELDPRTLDAVPAVAEKWSASENNRVWTFNLRENARWSNGKRITAADFVAAWKRLKTLGTKTAHRELLSNIVGFDEKDATQPESPDFQSSPSTESGIAIMNNGINADVGATRKTPAEPSSDDLDAAEPRPAEGSSKIGVEAVDEFTLKITLKLPDKDFPKLAANSIFRPVFGGGNNLEKNPLDEKVFTNGPFVIVESDASGVVIERSNTYWNKANVKLERIRFVPMETAEAALDAYKKGEIDAVTNAQFEPLALKLLEPYEDFRRTRHSALNFYEFNTDNPPFSDRRVREAFATAIDRERLIATELDSAAQPATDFLPLGEKNLSALSFDVKKARELLEKAGYPNVQGFPQLRLVINRNDTQQRVAAAVTKMWKQNLNIDTQVVVVENNEMGLVRSRGDFDIIRHGMVLPTTDELVCLAAIFRSIVKESPPQSGNAQNSGIDATAGDVATTSDQTNNAAGIEADNTAHGSPELITREDALYEVRAIPLYFPESYALVKPYVYGFDTNALDAPSIKDIGINNAWQPPKTTARN